MLASTLRAVAYASMAMASCAAWAIPVTDNLVPYLVRGNPQGYMPELPTWVERSGEGLRWAQYDQYDARWRLIDLGADGTQLRSTRVALGGGIRSARGFAHRGSETTLVGELTADPEVCRIVRLDAQLNTVFAAQHSAEMGYCLLADVLDDGRTVSYPRGASEVDGGRYFVTSADGLNTSMRSLVVPQGIQIREIKGNGAQLVAVGRRLTGQQESLFVGGFSPDSGALAWSRTLELASPLDGHRGQRHESDLWLVFGVGNDVQLARFDRQGLVGDFSPRFSGSLGVSDSTFVLGPEFGGVWATNQNFQSKLFGFRAGEWMQLTIPGYGYGMAAAGDGFGLLRNSPVATTAGFEVFFEERDWSGNLIQQRLLPGFRFASRMVSGPQQATTVFGVDLFINGLGQPVEGHASVAEVAATGIITGPRKLTSEADRPDLVLAQQLGDALYFQERTLAGNNVIKMDLAGRAQTERLLRGSLIHVDSRGLWTLEQASGVQLRLYSESGALLMQTAVPLTVNDAAARSSDTGSMWLLSGTSFLELSAQGAVVSEQSRPVFSQFVGTEGDTFAIVGGQLIRVDRRGAERHRTPVTAFANASALPDGDVLLASGQGFARIDRHGSIMWNSPSSFAAEAGQWVGNRLSPEWVWVATGNSGGPFIRRVTRVDTLTGAIVRSEIASPTVPFSIANFAFNARGDMVVQNEEQLAVFSQDRWVRTERLPQSAFGVFANIWFDADQRLFVAYPSYDGESIRMTFANDEGFFGGFER